MIDWWLIKDLLVIGWWLIDQSTASGVSVMAQIHTTFGHRNLETESAQRADSVKNVPANSVLLAYASQKSPVTCVWARSRNRWALTSEAAAWHIYGLDTCHDFALHCTLLYFTVLLCTSLYCTRLYCSVLHCTVLYCTVLDSTGQYFTILYCTVLYCTVLDCSVLHCTVLYCTVLDSTVQYSTVLYGILLT